MAYQSLLARKRGWLAAAALVLLPISTTGPATTYPAADSQASPAVQARWSEQDLTQLIAAIRGAEDEGLNPADYDLAALRRGVESRQGPSLDLIADAAAMRLANDFLFGRVTPDADMQWMIARPNWERDQLGERVRRALEAGDLVSFYRGLLPQDERYQAMRDMLAQTHDGAMRDRLRVNMERWRWMPRNLSADHIYVNVPSYRLDIVEGRQPVSSYDVVVGAPDTPTPQMISPTSSMVVNPSWYVPASIIKSSNLYPGKKGYVFKARGSGQWQVIQPPGPRNALGRIKFNLVNDQAIYLHDTPAKAAFKKQERALSHGCIRVSNIDQLAAELMTREGGDPVALEEALATNQTQTLRLPRQWPVYLVYFTMDRDGTGALTSYGDPYGYDEEVLARLDGNRASREMVVASR
jgi:L,D-transpeptidase YcbB